MRGSSSEEFGCNRCWPAEAIDAWAAKNQSTLETTLIDQSHFIVSVWRCPICLQNFLNVTTELVDWTEGEDPIYRTFMPITPAELGVLSSSTPSEADINAIGVGRRSLKYDWPKNQQSVQYWTTGILVGPHD